MVRRQLERDESKDKGKGTSSFGGVFNRIGGSLSRNLSSKKKDEKVCLYREFKRIM
jgi:hypothetical protein